jgi:hypothetical protein
MNLGRSLGGHERATVLGETDEWLTPPEIIAALGPFDLDPATPRTMPWATAARRYTIDDDGLAQPWEGRVWLNPPYGRTASDWLDRLADHGDGIALIFARTDTIWFADTVWRRADAVLFVKGRLRFYRTDGQQITRERSGGAGAGAPSVLVAYGDRNVEALRASAIEGHFVALDREEAANA